MIIILILIITFLLLSLFDVIDIRHCRCHFDTAPSSQAAVARQLGPGAGRIAGTAVNAVDGAPLQVPMLYNIYDMC